MTKKELRKNLNSGSILKNLFEFTIGQECLIYHGEFEPSDEIIYIPDIYLNDIDIDSVLNDEEIANVIKNCYTGKDFLNECSGHMDLAKELFYFVDWQHPNIQDDLETYDEDEFEKKFGFPMTDL